MSGGTLTLLENDSKLYDQLASVDQAEWEGENAEASAVLLSAPHVLAMSATPIPGTLALAMHGDMSITQVSNGIRESFYDNRPAGQPELVTETFHGNAKGRRDAYKVVRQELESGGRVLVVITFIGLSEELPDLHAAEIEYEILTEEF